jgi:hypothetical protein
MPDIREMLRTHSVQHPNMEAIAACAQACATCVAVCTICADACLSEPNPDHLRDCIRTDLHCADICAATLAVLVRLGRHDPQPLQAQLAACARAASVCADECRKHAAMHAHCRLCADACEACESACEDMMIAMRHAGESESSHR